jgi:ATP-dependent DNA ligase
MLCYPYEEKRLAKWEPPFLIQPKLDGERCRALITSTGVLLVSSEKNIINSVPHINEAIARMGFPEGTELDGELYNHGMEFGDIHSIVSRKVLMHDEATLMHYHIFDIIPVDKPEMLQGHRWMQLRDIGFSNPLVLVPGKFAFSEEEVVKLYNEYISMDYEGIIVRNVYAPYVRKRSIFVMKFKPKKKDQYEIIGFEEAIDKHGKPKDMLGSFICRGADGTPFGVGAGKLTHDERSSIWANQLDFLGKICEVQYQNLTPTGVPRFGLCIRTIAEAAQDSEADQFIKNLIMRR